MISRHHRVQGRVQRATQRLLRALTASMSLVVAAVVSIGLSASAPSTVGAATPDCSVDFQCVVMVTGSYSDHLLNISEGWLWGWGNPIVWGDSSSSPSANERFTFDVMSDGSFQIQDDASGYCITEARENVAPCANTAMQRWYLEPDPGGGYMIRSVNDNFCLNVHGGGYGVWSNGGAEWVIPYSCNPGDNASQWYISDLASGNYSASANPTRQPEMDDLAAKYALSECVNNTSYCSWVNTPGVSPTTIATAPICVDNTYLAPGGSSATSVFSVTTQSSWSQTLSNTISESWGITARIGGNNDPFQVGASFGQSFANTVANMTGGTKTYTYQESATLTPGLYTYLTLTPDIVEYQGAITFDDNSWAQWTFNSTGTNTVQVPLGNTMTGGIGGTWAIETSATAPICTGLS
jgi:ricin-type beta-trefoil lectin protein